MVVYIMRNAGLEETQAGIKIAGRNINNLRYADDTTLAESEEDRCSPIHWHLYGWQPRGGSEGLSSPEPTRDTVIVGLTLKLLSNSSFSTYCIYLRDSG